MNQEQFEQLMELLNVMNNRLDIICEGLQFVMNAVHDNSDNVCSEIKDLQETVRHS